MLFPCTGAATRLRLVALVATAALLAIAAAASPASAAPWRPAPPPITKYVSPTGGGNGSSPTSRLTLAQAIAQANPGDVFGLAPGTYDSASTRTVTRGGSASGYVTFRAEDPANQPLIRYTGTGTQGSGSYNGIFQLANGVNYVNFWDLQMRGDGGGGSPNTWALWGVRTGVGNVSRANHHVGVYGSRIWNLGTSAINTGQMDYLTAVGNQIWHTGYNTISSWSSGISLWTSYWSDSNSGFHSFIVGNVISGAYDAQNHTDGNGVIVDLQADSTSGAPPALIANNVMFGNGGRGFIATRSKNAWVVNNTAYRNQLDPAFTEAEGFAAVGAGAGKQHWFNNIAQTINAGGHQGLYVSSEAQSTHVMANNLHFGYTSAIFPSAWNTVDRLKVADPRFVNPPAIADTATASSTVAPWTVGDGLSVRSDSPAVDAGVDPRTHGDATAALVTGMNAYLVRDIIGAPRSARFDIGAYEPQSGTVTPTPTPTPTPSPTPTPTPAPATSINDTVVGTGLGQFSYAGSWGFNGSQSRAYLGNDHYSLRAGDSYTVKFSGTKIRLYVATAPNHGKSSVSVDGGAATTVDQYSATRCDQTLVYTSPTLAAGTHTLKVSVLGTKNAAATSAYVTADRVDVTP